MVVTLKWASLSPVPQPRTHFQSRRILAADSDSDSDSESESGLSLLPLSAFAVAEVTFNAIIYEFIFFAPPNRTLNAVCFGAVLVSVSVFDSRRPYCSLGWPGGHTRIDGSRAWGHMQTNGKTNETCIFYGTAAVCSPRLWAIISAISKAQVSVPLLLLLLLLLSSIV